MAYHIYAFYSSHYHISLQKSMCMNCNFVFLIVCALGIKFKKILFRCMTIINSILFIKRIHFKF